MTSAATYAGIRRAFHRVSRCALAGTVLAIATSLTSLPDAHATDVALTPVVLHLESNVTIDVGSRPLGSFSMDITYNPAVFTIEAIYPGTTPGFNSAVSTNATSFTSGVTPIANWSVTPVTGLVNVARIRFKAVGAAGTESAIGATNVYLLEPNSAPITAPTPNGFKASVSPRCLLDIDGDNQVLVGRDVLFVARARLNLTPVSASVRQALPGLPTDTAIREMVRQMCPAF